MCLQKINICLSYNFKTIWNSKRYSIFNRWFDYPMKHDITWRNPDNVTKKIDFSIPDSWIRQFVTYVRIYNLYFESDHRLPVTKLTTSVSKIACFHPYNKNHQSITPNLLKQRDKFRFL